MLYGISPVVQALIHRRRNLRRLLVRERLDSPRVREAVGAAGRADVPVESVSARRLAEVAGTKRNQGLVLECDDLPVLELADLLGQDAARRELILALDQIEDPQNFGGLVRTAAYLGASAVLTHRAHASPLSAAASKASAGALESLPVVMVGNLAQALSELRDRSYHLVGAALDPEAVPYQDATVTFPLVLVVGNEGEGLRALTRKRCDRLVRIDGEADTDSLNVTVAAGVLLAHLRLFRGGAPDR